MPDIGNEACTETGVGFFYQEMMMVQKPGLLTLEKTAQLLKTTQVNVLMHVRKGLLEQAEEDGVWYITIASFENFVGQNGIRKSKDVCLSRCAHAASCGSSCG